MIDLTKAVLPSSVKVDGKDYPIKTDFQYWIRFSIMAAEEGHFLNEFDFLYLFPDLIPPDRQKGINELQRFAFPHSELPRPSGNKADVIPYDWELDADLIYAAFFQQYKIDLCDEKLHLHFYKFMALFSGLKDTKFDDVIGWRFFNPGKKPDQKRDLSLLKKQWEIKRKLTAKEQKTIDDFRSHIKC